MLGNKASLKEYLGQGQSIKQGATPKEKDNSQYFELLQKMEWKSARGSGNTFSEQIWVTF